MDFIIEKGLPMPAAARHRRISKYPFAQLEVGDSFLVPDTPQSKAENRANSATNVANQRLAPKHFGARRVTEGVRIWRVA